MEFPDRSRAYKQADLYTLIVETDRALQRSDISVDRDAARDRLHQFYADIDDEKVQTDDTIEYRRAVLQAANDRANRRARGRVIEAQLVPAEE